MEAEEDLLLREELREAHDKLKHSYAEVKYLRQRVEQLSAENRVLRREPRRGQRDAVQREMRRDAPRCAAPRAVALPSAPGRPRSSARPRWLCPLAAGDAPPARSGR